MSAETPPPQDDATRALLAAIDHGSRDQLERALARGANPVALDPQDSQWRSALHLAAGRGMLNFLELMIKARPLMDLDTRCKHGVTAAHEALILSREPCALALLRAGANPGAQGDCGETLLYNAALTGQPKAIATLLALGADPRVATRVGKDPLDRARAKGYSEIEGMLSSAIARLELQESLPAGNPPSAPGLRV